MIKFLNVTKQYQEDKMALSDMTVNIDRGEFVFLVGPSGSGKSTFIKLLLKEIDPTIGKIKIDGKDITRISQRKIPHLRRKMGVVFQDFRLLQDKTVYENVAFAMAVINTSPKEIRRQVPNVLALVGISDRANMFPHQLSGGEQQRVAIARAIVNNPSVLIADEPTGNLDPETAWETMKLLKQINRRGTTILMATHAKDIVDMMQQRVIAIENGKIVRDDQKGVYGYED
ncbi:cell division ATP-binding protein FtsE [Lutibacter sp. B2]|nr:cell division ATP-binding protein FtsE [Lutibacter sp. B2]